MPTIKGLIVKDGKVTDGEGNPLSPFGTPTKTAPTPTTEPETPAEEKKRLSKKWTIQELYDYGKEKGYAVTKSMNKAELYETVRGKIK